MRTSIASELVELAKDEGTLFFHDQYRDPHALLSDDFHHGIRVQSREFRTWLSKLAYDKLGKVANSEAISTACSTIEGQALFAGPQLDLHVRIGSEDGKIYYDLGKGKFVEITSSGWSITDSPNMRFRLLSHQERQVEPVRGGDLRELLKFINLSDEARQRGLDSLFLIWLIASLIPSYPHPVLVAHGPHGSAKSTLFRLIKTLIDPSELKKMAPPTNPGDFAVAASRHWFLPLDNLSGLAEWLSDAICRASTGDGISRRTLFTDADEHIMSFQIVVALNGINLVVDKPDLLDRSLLLELKAVTPSQRQYEGKFWKEFKEKHAYFLGAIFDALSLALRDISNVDLKTMPRMADFARWGYAIAPAVGITGEEFLQAYEANIQDQHEEAVDASPVARCVIDFMTQRDYCELTPSDLLSELNRIAQRLQIDTKSRYWPKDPGWLWRRLVVAKNNLTAMGFDIERQSRGAFRIISIRRLAKTDVNGVSRDLLDP